MPGPAPKNSATRRPKADSRKLPASGRDGESPDWPLSEPSAAELDLWDELWATPMATAWESFGWFRVVARYARLLLIAEEPPFHPPFLAELRQLEDRLGMTPVSQARLRWEIVDDFPASVTPMAPKLRVVVPGIEE